MFAEGGYDSALNCNMSTLEITIQFQFALSPCQPES